MTWLTPSHRTCQRPKAHQSRPGARQLRVLRVRLACTTTWEARSIRMGPTPRWSPVAWRLVAATSRLGWRRRGPRNAGMYRYLAWQHSPPGEFGGCFCGFWRGSGSWGLATNAFVSHQSGQCVLGHDLRPSTSPLWGRSAACRAELGAPVRLLLSHACSGRMGGRLTVILVRCRFASNKTTKILPGGLGLVATVCPERLHSTHPPS